jgi:hypothetical protein
MTIQEIEARRDEIVKEMKSMTSMRRGTINEQFLKVLQKGRKGFVLRGPYYVLSRREENKTVSQRLTTPDAVEKARQEITTYHRYQTLSQEFVHLTEILGEMEETTTMEGGLKKKPKLRWNRMRK